MCRILRSAPCSLANETRLNSGDSKIISIYMIKLRVVPVWRGVRFLLTSWFFVLTCA